MPGLIRAEYPFQISWEDERLPRSLVCLRAESSEELGQAVLDVQLALAGALGEAEEAPVEPEVPARPAFVKPGQAPPPRPRGAGSSAKVAELPPSALKALLEQKKEIPCDCNTDWWDNRLTKKGRQPDFRCVKCGSAIWLTAYQESEDPGPQEETL